MKTEKFAVSDMFKVLPVYFLIKEKWYAELLSVIRLDKFEVVRGCQIGRSVMWELQTKCFAVWVLSNVK